MKRLFATCLLLTACSSNTMTISGVPAESGDVELLLQLQVVEQRSTLAVTSDISHVAIFLFKLQGASETVVRDAESNPVQADINYTGLNAPIRFSNLKPNTTYRARTIAYRDSGTADVDIISEQSDASMTEIVVGNNTGVIVAPIKLKLLPTTFSGQGTSSLQIQESTI